jgi:hypothetical protein
LHTELKKGTKMLPEKAVIIQTIRPMTPVLYVVKPPVETISSRHHRLSIDSQKPEDRDITDKLPQMLLASDNQSAANAFANILLSHK